MNQNFCPAPWTSIYVEPSGKIRNCCIATDTLGTVKDGLSTVFNGEKNIWIKQQMLEDKPVESCQQCWPGSQASLKDRFLDWYYKPESSIDFKNVSQFQPRYLDLRWHNTCNFACVYCVPVVSSAWAAELGIHQRMDSDDKETIKNYILNNLDQVDRVYLAGGEPLLIKENAELLEKLFEIKPDVQINVNSNISHANPSNSVYQQLTKFRNVQWIVSAEDIEHRFDYIRYGGSWNEFVKNLSQVERDFGKRRIGFNSVLCVLNALSIWNFVDWIVDRGYIPIQCSVSLHNQGTQPSSNLDPRVIGSEFVNKILSLAQQPKYSTLTDLEGLIKNLQQTKESVGPAGFLDFIQTLDKRRGLDSRQIFPDVYSYIDNL